MLPLSPSAVSPKVPEKVQPGSHVTGEFNRLSFHDYLPLLLQPIDAIFMLSHQLLLFVSHFNLDVAIEQHEHWTGNQGVCSSLSASPHPGGVDAVQGEGVASDGIGAGAAGVRPHSHAEGHFVPLGVGCLKRQNHSCNSWSCRVEAVYLYN